MAPIGATSTGARLSDGVREGADRRGLLATLIPRSTAAPASAFQPLPRFSRRQRAAARCGLSRTDVHDGHGPAASAVPSRSSAICLASRAASYACRPRRHRAEQRPDTLRCAPRQVKKNNSHLRRDGQKVWTSRAEPLRPDAASGAHHAQGAGPERTEGLSVFLVDMRKPWARASRSTRSAR